MLINKNEYFEVLTDIKKRIRTAQYKAVLGANREHILLYWNIGRVISENIHYGNSFIANLARDIREEFPDSKGFSERNLRYMRKFAETITDEANLQTLSANLSWSHNVLGIRRFEQVIGQCEALTPAQNVGGAKCNDLASRNPEPPLGSEAYTVCYAMLFCFRITPCSLYCKGKKKTARIRRLRSRPQGRWAVPLFLFLNASPARNVRPHEVEKKVS